MEIQDSQYKAGIGVLRKLWDNGFEAYFAGGCVRDYLLEITPFDYDVATNALPDQIESIFRRTISVGKAFGVIIVLSNNIQIEVATFRTDGKYSDNRRPDKVSFSSLREDVKRRDFTVNALMWNPIKDEIIDYVDGRKDLKKRLIRTVGDPAERFKEDNLRLMRAVRLANQLNFTIEKNTYNTIIKLSNLIENVSKERIADELKKIMVNKNRHLGIKMLDELGLLQYILPEVIKMKGVEQPQEFHPEGDVYVHSLLALQHLKKPSFELGLATLLHDVGKPETFTDTDRIRFNRHEFVGKYISNKICKRLKLSNDSRSKILWLIEKHMIFKDVIKMRDSKLKKLFRNPYFDDLIKLYEAEKKSMNSNTDELEFCKLKKKEFENEELRPKLLLTGNDLIKLGLTPGPVFSEILSKLEDLQLENIVKTKEEAIDFVKKYISPNNVTKK